MTRLKLSSITAGTGDILYNQSFEMFLFIPFDYNPSSHTVDGRILDLLSVYKIYLSLLAYFPIRDLYKKSM